MDLGHIDPIDEFLDYSVVGFEALRRTLDVPFLVDDERLQTEYPYQSEIPRDVRIGWHPMINQLYLYWRLKIKVHGRLPDRADMDPLLEIPLLCPHICIFEPIAPAAPMDAGRLDWYSRIVGTKVDAALGFGLTGHLISEFIADLNHPQTLRYGLVAVTEKVSHRRGHARTPVEERYGWAESLYLPITDNRRGTKAAFGIAIYQWLT